MVLDEARDIGRVDPRDAEILDVGADSEHAIAKVFGGEIRESKVVSAGYQAEQFGTFPLAWHPIGRSRADECRLHRLATAVYATDRYRRTCIAASSDGKLLRHVIVAFVSQQPDLVAAARGCDKAWQIADGGSVSHRSATVRAGAGRGNVVNRHKSFSLH